MRTITCRSLRRLLAAAVSSVLLASPWSAHADLLWDFSWTFGSGTTASGTLTTGDSPISGEYYRVIGLAGTQAGNAMTLLAPGGFVGNDNLFDADGPRVFTLDGLSYSDGSGVFNIFTQATGNMLVCSGAIGGSTCQANIHVQAFEVRPTASVPEPGTLTLLGVLGAGLFAAMRRRAS